MSELPTATRQATIETFLDDAKRSSLPLSVAFVQQGTQRQPLPGPLAAFVRAGSERLLEQYLLLHAFASAAPFNVARDSRIWARMLGFDDSPSSRSAVSKGWKWMADRKLVAVGRRGRLADVTILRDDGTGRPYRHPGRGRSSRYLQLGFAYWRDGWFERLTLPGKAMLLVALSLGDDFPLPYDRAPDWYGISAMTAERGLRELRRTDVLNVRHEYKAAPRAPQGRTRQNYYKLRPPFGPRGVRSKSAPPEART